MFENFVGLFDLDKRYYADRLLDLAETRFGVNPLEFGPSEFVDKIMTETLLVHCNHDLESKSDISIMVHEKMPNSQLYLTNNLGHKKLLGDAAVIQRITDFIQPLEENYSSSILVYSDGYMKLGLISSSI